MTKKSHSPSNSPNNQSPFEGPVGERPASIRPAGPEPSAVLSNISLDEAELESAVSKSRAVLIITSITCITGIGNLLAGLLTVGIPAIAADLDIPPEQQLWPTAAFALACGCTLLPCGAVADILGCRRESLLGGLLQALSALGTGLVTNGVQLISLRVIAGLSASMCLPGAVGVAANVFPATSSPRLRSISFAAIGGGQAVGFGLGLVLGGVFSETIGWRWGFYTTAILNSVVIALAFGALPHGIDGGNLGKRSLSRLAQEVEWTGALLVSTSLALLSYELAVCTGPSAEKSIRQPLNIAFLCIGLALLPAFGLWMRRQAHLKCPALILNSIWSNLPFTATCVTVFFVWGALNASEQLTAFYLQYVRSISALKSSLYFLPAPICGLLMNVAIGALLPYLRPAIAVPFGCLVSGIAPLLLATLCHSDGPGYWGGIFQAMALNPLGADLIYTIANLVMTAAFPDKMQALAGGVFNMLAQIGKSVGIATSAVIARQITANSGGLDPKDALLFGYQAGWWYNCALSFVSVAVSFGGLRSLGKLGIKRE